jgi:hypothetical protein
MDVFSALPVDVVTKDLLLGFFMALALKRGRIQQILDRFLPSENRDLDSK